MGSQRSIVMTAGIILPEPGQPSYELAPLYWAHKHATTAASRLSFIAFGASTTEISLDRPRLSIRCGQRSDQHILD